MAENKEVVGYRCQKGILCDTCAALNVYEHNLDGTHEDITDGTGLSCGACGRPLYLDNLMPIVEGDRVY